MTKSYCQAHFIMKKKCKFNKICTYNTKYYCQMIITNYCANPEYIYNIGTILKNLFIYNGSKIRITPSVPDIFLQEYLLPEAHLNFL